MKLWNLTTNEIMKFDHKWNYEIWYHIWWWNLEQIIEIMKFGPKRNYEIWPQMKLWKLIPHLVVKFGKNNRNYEIGSQMKLWKLTPNLLVKFHLKLMSRNDFITFFFEIYLLSNIDRLIMGFVSLDRSLLIEIYRNLLIGIYHNG